MAVLGRKVLKKPQLNKTLIKISLNKVVYNFKSQNKNEV